MRERPDVHLTEAEWAVLELRVRDGLSVAQIARRRHGVARTVQNHFNRIYQKLSVGKVDPADKRRALEEYYWAHLAARSAGQGLRLVAAGEQGRPLAHVAPDVPGNPNVPAPPGTRPAPEPPNAAPRLRALRGGGADPGGDAPPRAGIFPPLPPLVLGRSEALREIKARLSWDGAAPDRPPGQRLTVIRGWPGVGKSTLAACLAHDEDLAAHFPDGVLWAALGPQPSVLGALAAWGRALALEGLAHMAEVAEISQHLARHLADKRLLLIVDDVWAERDARPFMMGGRGCALLLTTRLPGVAEALAPTPAAIYPLPVLAAGAALALLRTLAPNVTRAHPAACRELVRELQGLPLALQVAGHLLEAEARLGWGWASC